MSETTTVDTFDRIGGALDGLTVERVPSNDGSVVLIVERDALHDVLAALRDGAGFESATFVTGVDHFPAEPRYEVVHQLASTRHNDRVRVRTRLAEDDARVPTCTDLWPGAGYAERECYDMFGIEFDGNPDLRRLLMPEGYEHHPLRKDFPHQGIEPDRLYRAWDRERRAAEERP